MPGAGSAIVQACRRALPPSSPSRAPAAFPRKLAAPRQVRFYSSRGYGSMRPGLRGAATSRRGSLIGLGLAASATGGLGVYMYFEDYTRTKGLEADSARAKAAAEEHDRRWKAEVERLTAQASWWRLAELFLTMLPAVFAWPLWLVDPQYFWSIVAMRVDCCGPTFVKLAQWLATRRDIFPETVCEAFSSMHQKVTARWSRSICASDVQATLELNDVALRSIEPTAHASGSIAEVFFAVLEDGTDVAVKCLRPGVQALLEADLAWLLKFGQWANQVEVLRLLGIRQTAEDFCEHVQMQTDLRTEASHLERFRANFADCSEAVRFPVPLYANRETLVLSRENGQELARIFQESGQASQEASSSSTSSLQEPTTMASAYARAEDVRHALGIPLETCRRIAKESMSCYMRMIFNDQFIHGDLHPGNIMLHINPQTGESAPCDGIRQQEAAMIGEDRQPQGLLARASSWLPSGLSGRQEVPGFELVILDAGLAIPLPREKVEVLRSLAISIIYADFGRAADLLYNQSTDNSRCWDPAAFKRGLAKAFQDCRKNVWDEGFVQVSDACLEALRLVQYYQVGLDTTLTWTLFGMLSVEGSARRLDPQVDCAQAANRYILTVPSILREMRQQSWVTTRHMCLELLFNAFGMDYWDYRYRNGLTWKELQS